MTPEAWAAIASFLDRFGLPILMLAVLGYLILKRRLVTGAEADGWKALYERERVDRIAAQTALAEFAPANAKLAEAVSSAVETVMRSRNPDPYTEREEGRRRG